MTTQSPPSALTPERLSRALADVGWRMVGNRPGVYNRYAVNTDDGLEQMVIVPLDPKAADFQILLDTAWRAIQRSPFQSAVANLLNVRAHRAFDALRFRKETSAPRGLIVWTAGEELIASARETLTAGAKAFMGPRRKFGPSHAQFAHRYLDSVFMGQTTEGSYIVTALAPVEAAIPVSHRRLEDVPRDGDVVTGRAVTESVMRAVEATVEALHHYRASGSFSGFEEGAPIGVSYEIVGALHRLAENADEATVAVEWEPATQSLFDPPQSDRGYLLTGADAEPLERARQRLAVVSEPIPLTKVKGRVHLLTKKDADGPGVVGVHALTVTGSRRFRVRLDSDDYHRAVAAHYQDAEVTVQGTLEREGNLSWLYKARLIDVSEAAGPYSDLLF